jgi:ketosteroid isomerase-like protein
MTMRSLAALFLVASGALGEERAMPATRVVEIRSYNLKPGSRAEFHRLAGEVAVPMLKRWDIDVVGHGPSAHDDDSYFLIRSFASLDERNRREDAFYGSEEWRSGPREPILALISSYTTVVIEMDARLVEEIRTAPSAASPAPDEEARRAVAALDTDLQAAVKRNDAGTLARILHDDFVLVLGNGQSFTREDILQEARSGQVQYEKQDEDEGTRTVRVWGDTAVVTARVWLKGRRRGEPFDRRLWFSDTYVRTPAGWRMVFGQASLSLPPDAAAGPK